MKLRRTILAALAAAVVTTALVADAQASYTFTMPRPMGYCRVISDTSKQLTVEAPIVYSGNGGAQYVYWRGYTVDRTSGRRIARGGWVRGVAYAGQAARFAVTEQFLYGNANLNKAGVEVRWYLGGGRWRAAYWDPILLAYADVFGTRRVASAC